MAASPDQDQGEDVRSLGADEYLLAFPNMRVFHDLGILLADWSLLAELTGVLKDHGAKIERLSRQAQASSFRSLSDATKTTIASAIISLAESGVENPAELARAALRAVRYRPMAAA